MTPLKIGILGGSFNPIHHAHLRNAQWALEQFQLDKIIFMPSGQPAYKTTKVLESGKHRSKMVELAIQGNNHFEMNTLEVDNEGVHYTFNTVNALKKIYPNADFYMIIGADMVDILHTWYRIEELSKMITFIGITRQGYALQSSVPFEACELPLLEISSSQIRERIREHKSVQYLMPDQVIRYIKQEGLYVD